MREITIDELAALLEAHPEWRFFKYENEFTYEANRKRFTWYGWDHYNDWSTREIVNLYPTKRQKKFYCAPEWYKITLHGNKIFFWTQRAWEESRRNRERREKDMRPSFKLEVLVNAELENPEEPLLEEKEEG